jgi:flagellar basal body-associated protein FliL
VVDSSGQTVARTPVFEVVAEESGTPVLLIVLILLALLVAVLVAAFVMKKQRAKLNTSDSSSSV